MYLMLPKSPLIWNPTYNIFPPRVLQAAISLFPESHLVPPARIQDGKVRSLSRAFLVVGSLRRLFMKKTFSMFRRLFGARPVSLASWRRGRDLDMRANDLTKVRCSLVSTPSSSSASGRKWSWHRFMKHVSLTSSGCWLKVSIEVSFVLFPVVT